MATINEMRIYISNRYDNMKWKNRVSKMPTRQVIAVYRRFKELDAKARIEETYPNPEYHQIDMFEYLYSINEGKETHTEVNV
jgi:hypothetical protein